MFARPQCNAALTELENISEVPKELELVWNKLLERKERCEVRINDPN